MIKYEVYEGVIDMDVADTSATMIDASERGRLRNIINNLNMYADNVRTITELYTKVLMDENVSYFLPKITQQDVFMRHFPELFVYNEFGENLFNCQQNSKYHKYSVFYHIVSSIENANVTEISVSDWQKKILKWAMFLHDIGKPYVKTVAEDGTESFAGHCEKSIDLAQAILSRFDFSENERNIICTLIKYHDLYLNVEEVTQENLTFLANGLNNDRELFYLLINVKDADAKAKSIEVYNDFKVIKQKYYEFANTYFSQSTRKKIEVSDNSKAQEKEDDDKDSKEQEVKLTSKEIKELIDEIITKKTVKVRYQPIVDLRQQCVYGYEALTQISINKKIKIEKLLEVAKDYNDYDKLQQILFTNAVEQFENVVNRESNIIMVNIDYDSYVNYVNKPRIYDMMARNKVVIEFKNYENKDLTDIQETITGIHLKGGKVAFDNFTLEKMSIEDICYLDIDYIIPDMSYIKDIHKDFEKQKYINSLITYTISKDINLIAVGVEDKKILDTLKLVGVRLVQGYYFGKPSPDINMINDSIMQKLNTEEDQSIM
ncbi:MAG: EAL domain-containing protein [Clostridia bacterium]|nr:EAL domain-containing protein [Clostridia bacterium]